MTSSDRDHQPTPSNPRATIAVSGSGTVSGPPDTLMLDLGVSVLARSVGEATGQAAAGASAVMAALGAAGVHSDDVQTTNYSIHPEFDYSRNVQRLIGYRVSNTVSVCVRDIPGAGSVIDAATTAGGDAVVVNGVRFEIEDDTPLLRAARAAAWHDALGKAGQLAELAGAVLGRAVSITESAGWTPSPMLPRRAALDVTAESTPIHGGHQQVSVNIDVAFAIE
ncbi:MAG: SIMPL domain-containing protein [Acidimicrobiia bacterium]